MITNTTAKMTYTFTEGITEYAVGFVYQTNPDGSPQIKVYINDAVNTPLVYGTDYTMSQDGTKVVIASGAEVGDSLTIIRNIPIVQLSDYVVGRIDPEQIENDFDLCVERDQQQSARITVTEEQLAAHDERISDIEEVIPESAATDNLLATVSDIPTDLAELTNSPGYITGITSSDVTTALGYTPYDASNPNGYTTNTGTVTSVNNVQPVNGNVTLEFPTAVQSDWAQSDNTKVDYIKNKPTIPTVNNATITITQGGVTKGSFSLNQTSGETIALDAGGSGGGAVDSVNGYTGVVVLTASDVGALPDSTTIPDAQIQSDWNQSDNTKVDYIKNKPTIPAAQVNSDWNAVSGVAQILNKPTIPAAQVNSDWDAVSGVAQILNKPTIPTVNDSTITITQGGVTKGTFTTNQGSAGTIALDAGGATQKTVNAKIVGNLTINGSDVSDFSSSNYLETFGNFGLATATTFEIVIAFTSPSSFESTTLLMKSVSDNNQRYFNISIYNSVMRVVITTANPGGGVVSQSITGQTTLSANTKYYAKFTNDGTNYTLSLSTNDGQTYTQEETKAVTSTVPSEITSYELGAGSANPVTALHMDGWYVKVNNAVVWQGMVGHDLVSFQMPTSSNNYTWYRKYADGWVEQGGMNITVTSTIQTWTLPVTMADTHYAVQFCKGGDNGNYAYAFPDTVSTIKYKSSAGSDQTNCAFVICGMAA